MKSQAKQFAIAFAFTLVSITQLGAQPMTENSTSLSNKEITTAITNYNNNLKMENNGVIESTLYQILALAKRYPTADYSTITENLKTLSFDVQDDRIRFKAHLTYQALNNKALLESVAFTGFIFSHKVYAGLNEQLNRQYLAQAQR